MEVHAHTHTPRKKWTHYFWEFLMLFLAVFCGFLAEYQLEHVIEHNREKQYMQNLYEDLKRDSIIMTSEIRARRGLAGFADSLITELDSAQQIKNTKEVYFHAYVILGVRALAYSNATIEQLKNSGSLRLIRKKGIADSIINYDIKVLRYKEREEAEREVRFEYRKVVSTLLNARTLIEMEDTSLTYLSFKKPSENIPLLTTDTTLLNQIKGLAAQLHSRHWNAIIYLKGLLKDCNRLMALLKKEYYVK